MEEESVEQVLKNCGIDWKLLAKQVSFWIENNEEGYLSWLKKGKLPPDLYPAHMEVSVNAENAENYHPDIGFSQDGVHPDIGCYNGPLGMVEWEKAIHLLVLLMLGLAEYKFKKLQEI
jgi:hypothetical protein